MRLVHSIISFFRRARPQAITGALRYHWVEESFSVAQPIGNQRPLPQSAQFVGVPVTKQDVRWLVIIGIILVSVLVGRLFYLQGIRGSDYFTMAEDNRIRVRTIPAKRGLVYDRAMQPLVTNVTDFSLALVPGDLPRDLEEKDQVIRTVAEHAGLAPVDIYTILDEYKKYSYETLTIREGIPYETALLLDIASTELPGIRIEHGSERNYRNIMNTRATSTPHSMAHLIGYVGKLTREELEERYPLGYTPSDRIGKVGIEATYEDFLRGNYGKRRVEVDATGREQLILAEELPVPGRHVVLGIDSAWQRVLEEALQRAFRSSHATRGAAVVLEPHTGVIRALVSLPAYDNNDFVRGITSDRYSALIEDPDRPLFPRAISGTYPSGSTIKPLIAAAALEEGRITRETTIFSSGGIEVGRWFFPDWKTGGHGVTNIVKAIAESVNTFFYRIGGGYREEPGMGVETITKYLRLFGLAHPLGIDLPGEVAGFLPSPAWKKQTKKEAWYIGDTYNLSIGQGDVLVTPLQIASAVAAIANGGTLYRPHLVERVVDPITNEVQPVEPQPLTKLPIKPEHLITVRSGMRTCVTDGSCRALSSLPVPISGKTGTAEWTRDRTPHAWFTGFAPSTNPEVVIAVIIEEGGEGSKTALPVALEFFRYWGLSRNAILPTTAEFQP